MTNIKQMETAITAKVWQAIARSGIDVSAVGRDDMDALVRLVVDAALEAADTELGQPAATMPAASALVDSEEEQVLWAGRPFLSLTLNYIITNERVRIIHGLLGKDYEDIELVRVQDVDFKQSMTERAMNLGDIFIASHDPSNPQATLKNITDPKGVHEILRRAVISARKTYGLRYREEM